MSQTFGFHFQRTITIYKAKIHLFQLKINFFKNKVTYLIGKLEHNNSNVKFYRSSLYNKSPHPDRYGAHQLSKFGTANRPYMAILQDLAGEFGARYNSRLKCFMYLAFYKFVGEFNTMWHM